MRGSGRLADKHLSDPLESLAFAICFSFRFTIMLKMPHCKGNNVEDKNLPCRAMITKFEFVSCPHCFATDSNSGTILCMRTNVGKSSSGDETELDMQVQYNLYISCLRIPSGGM